MAEQLWYTWTTNGLAGRAGEQVRAASPGVTDRGSATASAAHLVCRNPNAAEAFGWIDHDIYRLCFTASSAVGLTADGRKGNFFVHVLVGELSEMPLGALARLRNSPFWQRADDPLHGQVLPTVDVAQLVGPPQNGVVQEEKEHFLSAVLTHALDYGSTVVGDGPHVGELAAVLEALPATVCRRGFRTSADPNLTQMFQVMSGSDAVRNTSLYDPDIEADRNLLRCAQLLLQQPQPEIVTNAAIASGDLQEFCFKLRANVAARTGALSGRECAAVVHTNALSIEEFVADPEDLRVFVRALITLDERSVELVRRVAAAVGPVRLAAGIAAKLDESRSVVDLVKRIAVEDPATGGRLSVELARDPYLGATVADGEACRLVLASHHFAGSTEVEECLPSLAVGLGHRARHFVDDESIDAALRGRVAVHTDFGAFLTANRLLKDERFTRAFLENLSGSRLTTYGQLLDRADQRALVGLCNFAFSLRTPPHSAKLMFQKAFIALPIADRWDFIERYRGFERSGLVDLPVSAVIDAWVDAYEARLANTQAPPLLQDLGQRVGGRIVGAGSPAYWSEAFAMTNAIRNGEVFVFGPTLTAQLTRSGRHQRELRIILMEMARSMIVRPASDQLQLVLRCLDAPQDAHGRMIVYSAFLESLNCNLGWTQVSRQSLAYVVLSEIIGDVDRDSVMRRSAELRKHSAPALKMVTSAKKRQLADHVQKCSGARARKWFREVAKLASR